MADIAPRFEEIGRPLYSTQKRCWTPSEKRVSDNCLTGTTGYGYNDKGRDVLTRLRGRVSCEAALVRIGFLNGNHAITSALLPPLKRATSPLRHRSPLRTLRGVIGMRAITMGRLKDYGVATSRQTDAGRQAELPQSQRQH
jgi:cystathionine beta-lyase family protein involved in aluminum resistance